MIRFSARIPFTGIVVRRRGLSIPFLWIFRANVSRPKRRRTRRW